MRWSLASSFFIFAVLIAGEFAFSAPINVDSDILLEARNPVTTRAMARGRTQNRPTTRSMTQARTHNPSPPTGPLFHNPPPHKRAPSPHNPAPRPKPKDKVKRAKAAQQVRSSISASPLRAGHFKKSSGTYRKAALKGPTFHRTGTSGIIETKTGSSLDPGTHADHMVEAQTVAHAVKKAGYSKSDIHPKTLENAKDVLNSSDNMAAISGRLNIEKGIHTTSKLAGGSGSNDPHVHHLMDKTRDKTTAVAKQLNQVFKDGGNPDVNVLSAQLRTMKISDPKTDGKK